MVRFGQYIYIYILLCANYNIKKKKTNQNSADITFATLWDSKKQELVGMLTITDFIDILLHFHNKTNVIQEMAEYQIRKWREIGTRSRPRKLISVAVEEQLWTAIKILQQNRIHRLPVMHESNLLCIITHSPVLAFLVANVRREKQTPSLPHSLSFFLPSF